MGLARIWDSKGEEEDAGGRAIICILSGNDSEAQSPRGEWIAG